MKPGQRVILFSELRSDEGVQGTVKSVHAGEVLLDVPEPTSALSFEKGEQLQIQHLGEQFTLYCWQARVESITASRGEGQQVTVSVTDEGVRVQRRFSYRLNLAIPFSFIIMEARDTTLVGHRITGVTNDISVGGLSFETDLPLQMEDKLSIRLNLPETQAVTCIGSVVRVEEIQRDEEYLSLIGVQFLTLQSSHQIGLIDFLAQHTPES